ncbi:MAG: UDP-N-acetylmuramoyl-L-alanyl-D-glutamate--2,6-diaminopimelate ligase [Kiritimatiellaceae bacterium TMED266]|nr:MAG: UDP-N-acetylmuramoyl-L-alanyl-D-glutamate--2,6-diaminopimelate ligase [Kiritimatiellaceae bacterium TMED266]
MKVGDFIAALNYPVKGGDPEREVTGVVSDSRMVLPGSVFVCVRGAVSDGHSFAENAVERGAVLVVAELELRMPDEVGVMQVSCSRRALGELARVFYGPVDEQLGLVGITGTNGKTSTSFMVQHLFQHAGVETGLIGTIQYDLGSRILPASRTTPEADALYRYVAEMVQGGCKRAVMEVSSHAIDLERVHGLMFEVVVFTNLSPEHLDYHQDMERYYEVKRRLFEGVKAGVGMAVVNVDDAWGRRLAAELGHSVIRVGEGEGATVRARDIEGDAEGLRFELVTPWGEGQVRLSLMGRFHVANALAAVAVAGHAGLSFKQIKQGLKGMGSIPGRLELVRSFRGRQVFVDYAHTPDALEKVLEAVRVWVRGRLWIVFGCGGDRDRQKRALMGAVAERLSDQVVLTSDNPRSEEPAEICDEIKVGCNDESRIEVVLDRREAIYYAMGALKRGDVLLVAGKGHETYQEQKGTLMPFDDREVVREWKRT